MQRLADITAQRSAVSEDRLWRLPAECGSALPVSTQQLATRDNVEPVSCRHARQQQQQQVNWTRKTRRQNFEWETQAMFCRFSTVLLKYCVTR